MFAFWDVFPNSYSTVVYWRPHSIAQQSKAFINFAGYLQGNKFSFKRHLIKLFFTDIASVAFYDPYKIKIFHSILNYVYIKRSNWLKGAPKKSVACLYKINYRIEQKFAFKFCFVKPFWILNTIYYNESNNFLLVEIIWLRNHFGFPAICKMLTGKVSVSVCNY